MPKKLEKISAVLNKTLSSRGLGSRLKEYRILGRWEKIVGRIIARHAHPVSFRAKKLVIAVDSSAWMQQLSLLKSELLEKLNQSLGSGAVESIVFKIGEVQKSLKTSAAPSAFPRLDARDSEKIETYVHDMQDPEVKTVLRRLIEKDMMHKKRDARTVNRTRTD